MPRAPHLSAAFVALAASHSSHKFSLSIYYSPRLFIVRDDDGALVCDVEAGRITADFPHITGVISG